MSTFALYGDSYIRHLGRFCGYNLKRCLVAVTRKRLPTCLTMYCPQRNKGSRFSLANFELSMDKDFLLRLTQRFDFSEEGVKKLGRKRELERMKKDQTFRKDRLVKLGPDLAASAFLIARGGTVKFVGKEPWVKKTGVQLVSLPGKFDPEFKLEGIDCSRVKFHHVGMDNLVDLEHLKYINFSNNQYVDDWFLARLQVYRNSLEFLDISGCENITSAGILALYQLRNLKVLKMTGCLRVRNQEFIALLLENHIPDLQVIGVDTSTDIIPEDIAEKAKIDKDVKELDFQSLQSRFLTMGDILNEEGKVISTTIGKGLYDPIVDDGVESFIDTDNVSQEELEQRLSGRGQATRL